MNGRDGGVVWLQVARCDTPVNAQDLMQR